MHLPAKNYQKLTAPSRPKLTYFFGISDLTLLQLMKMKNPGI